MKYFSYTSNSLTLKNKLEIAVHDYLKDNERQVIPALEVKKFKEKIVKRIDELNKTHIRCTPVKVQWDSWNNKDYSLSGAHFCSFHLFASNN